MDHEIAELKAELARLKAEAEAANLARSDFITNLSHELGNGLSIIIQSADLFSVETKNSI